LIDNISAVVVALILRFVESLPFYNFNVVENVVIICNKTKGGKRSLPTEG
jgi:hypothetical protein